MQNPDIEAEFEKISLFSSTESSPVLESDEQQEAILSSLKLLCSELRDKGSAITDIAIKLNYTIEYIQYIMENFGDWSLGARHRALSELLRRKPLWISFGSELMMVVRKLQDLKISKLDVMNPKLMESLSSLQASLDNISMRSAKGGALDSHQWATTQENHENPSSCTTTTTTTIQEYKDLSLLESNMLRVSITFSAFTSSTNNLNVVAKGVPPPKSKIIHLVAQMTVEGVINHLLAKLRVLRDSTKVYYLVMLNGGDEEELAMDDLLQGRIQQMLRDGQIEPDFSISLRRRTQVILFLPVFLNTNSYFREESSRSTVTLIPRRASRASSFRGIRLPFKLSHKPSKSLP